MKVSIVIINYNYAHFLREAIDSALNQSHPNVEVVVVDDGSSDSSRSVIEAYGTRIKAVFQENQGSNAATNSGLFAAGGDVVIFLDADDKLKPTIVEDVVDWFKSDRDLARVQYLADFIDSYGNSLTAPSWWRGIDWVNGSCKLQLLAGKLPAWPPTSCNAYRRTVLDRIGPVPEGEVYRVCVDLFLCNLSSYYGKVRSLRRIGACYRIHDSNNYSSSKQRRDIRKVLSQSRARHRLVFESIARAEHNPELATRLSRKHLGTVRGDLALTCIEAVGLSTRLGLGAHGILASMRSSKLNLVGKLLSSGWFAACAVLPGFLANKLVSSYYNERGHGRIVRLPLRKA